MKIYEEKNYEDMSRRAASIILSTVALKPNCILGLATGSSPIGTYKNLIRWNQEKLVSFKNVKSVNLDEYNGLSGEHDQSYRFFMNDNLFNHIDIKSENTNVPNGLASDAAAECARYDALINSLGGVDLQLLGLGHNGHIAFNEPCDNFPKGTHLVDLSDSTIKANTRFFASESDVPRQAFTMGTGVIMSAKTVLIVVSGAEKAAIVAKAFAGDVTPQVPASVLQFHPNVILVGDSAALSELKKTGATICN